VFAILQQSTIKHLFKLSYVPPHTLEEEKLLQGGESHTFSPFICRGDD
jgi:hypothetical protein